MSNKLGRNPFDKKKKVRAADIVREMNAAAEIAAWHPEPKEGEGTSREPKTAIGRAAKFVLVDLPANSIVLGLKAYCLSIALFDRF